MHIPQKNINMTEIIRNRTIRTSSRKKTSKSYKIDTKNVNRNDLLVVNIDHETKSFQKTYKFYGADVASKDSISFRVQESVASINISWSGAKPIGPTLLKSKKSTLVPLTKKQVFEVVSKPNSTYLKMSFEPISNPNTTILILGTMPGDKSLELGEYYGHSRNRFWKIISTITNNEVPITYFEKKNLLFKTNIGIWDVAKRANRNGSLDNAIENVEPNDIDDFVIKHKNLKVIGFNGAKSEELFNKYFKKRPGIKYISLPSTSPANTKFDFNSICISWKQILSH
jgi:hypoxanthine-DNA glycosylase